jgi:excisionase family DNA binding protein
MSTLFEKAIESQPEPVFAPERERASLRVLAELLRPSSDRTGAQNCPSMVGPDGTSIELPDTIVQLLRQIVSHLAKGHALTVVPLRQELTTQQAADLLNVSRPFLIGLLERREIPFVKIGKHRRIRYEDLMRYKRGRDAGRRQALDRLTALSQQYGLDDFED